MISGNTKVRAIPAARRDKLTSATITRTIQDLEAMVTGDHRRTSNGHRLLLPSSLSGDDVVSCDGSSRVLLLRNYLNLHVIKWSDNNLKNKEHTVYLFYSFVFELSPIDRVRNCGWVHLSNGPRLREVQPPCSVDDKQPMLPDRKCPPRTGPHSNYQKMNG